MKKRILIVSIIIIILNLIGILIYQTVYLDYITDISLNINGKKEITLNLLENYKEDGYNAYFRNENITDKVEVLSNVDNTKIGEYFIEYRVNYKNKSKSYIRKINIVDIDKPIIELIGEDKITIYINEKYNEPGYKATDNYDGDITNNVVIEGNIDNTKMGIYNLTYKVKDSSNNTFSITRTIEVKQRYTSLNGVAVLNYHFFYSDGENCGQNICLNTTKFEQQLNYLKNNGYKTLTMNEFVKWIYGEIEIPKKSVLLTIDDGAMGTGKHNGNKLIPLLEKYDAHATLFLITGWWDIDNYRSPNLDIESHTNDMHNEGYCSGVIRGARMLCSSYDVALSDLKKSIEITGSNQAFCYPFYVYNNNAIKIVKDAGFKVAFAGGSYKATRNSNKFAIPRYIIYDNTSLETFINYIS